MMFGPWGNDDRADSIRIIHRALDAGINFVDTADVYSNGVSEEIVGEALAGRRDDVVLATKFFMPMSEEPNSRWVRAGGSSAGSRTRCGGSAPTTSTCTRCTGPARTSSRGDPRGADRPRPAGKVRYIGSSSYSSSQIVEAQWASRERRLERFVTEQPPYSILVRGIEEDVLPTAQRYGMGTLTYSPLAGGWLSGRWRKDAASTPASSARPSARFDMSSPANQRKRDIVEDLAQLAEQAGMTLIEMAIAFLLNHPGVTSAIVGPRTMEQLESYLPAVDITLSTGILDRIDELVAPGVTVNPDDNSYGA